MSFIYFLPGEHGVTPEILEKYGLSEVFPGGGCEMLGISEGPGGGFGQLVETPGGQHKSRGYKPEHQTWRDAGKYWVGYRNDSKPKPADLVRRPLIPGYPVELGDGNEWVIPAARLKVTQTALPEVLGVDASGNLVQSVHPDFAKLYDHGSRILDWLRAARDGQVEDIPVGEQFAISVDALSTNYRIGAQEISLLGLLTTINMMDLFLALVDFPGMREIEQGFEASKKKDPVDTGADTSSS